LACLALPILALTIFGFAGEAKAAPGLNAKLSAHPPYTCRTNVYVDAVNGNDSNPGTAALPWKTITNADNGWSNTPVPGECVNVLPGTYALQWPMTFTHGGTKGSWDNYVIYRSTVPQGAHILATANMGSMIDLLGSYFIIDGFEIDGNNVTTGGVGINACNGKNPIVNNVLVINNLIHDMGSAGVSMCGGDFYYVLHNEVYHTSSTDPWQVSAIDLWEPQAVYGAREGHAPDGSMAFSIQIDGNLVHDNAEGPSIPYPHSDGNGIIVDTTMGSNQCPSCGTPYAGNILVKGNVSYNNGGCGINVFLSNNVVVAQNTVYNNHLDTMIPYTARGELSNGGSINTTWIDNIAYAVPGSGILANNSPAVSSTVGSFPASATWVSNITYGGSVEVASVTRKGFLQVNPDLVDPPAGNFMPKHGSPAIKAGQPASYIPATQPDIGAY
jgi:hypothetical protein